MSVKEILREIELLPSEERQKVLDGVRRMLEPEIPESFREGMADIKAGRVVDMDKALFEPYPGDEP
jgi:predicted transcriptional regulator